MRRGEKEHEKCNDETLLGRLNWIRGTIADAWGKDKARSSEMGIDVVIGLTQSKAL
jgi:hypothetical protein